MIGKKATARIVTLALCGALAVSGIAVLVVPAVALGECSCSIEVHGSNCPLSRCTCDGATTGAHAGGCPLAEVNADLTVCLRAHDPCRGLSALPGRGRAACGHG